MFLACLSRCSWHPLDLLALLYSPIERLFGWGDRIAKRVEGVIEAKIDAVPQERFDEVVMMPWIGRVCDWLVEPSKVREVVGVLTFSFGTAVAVFAWFVPFILGLIRVNPTHDLTSMFFAAVAFVAWCTPWYIVCVGCMSAVAGIGDGLRDLSLRYRMSQWAEEARRTNNYTQPYNWRYQRPVHT